MTKENIQIALDHAILIIENYEMDIHNLFTYLETQNHGFCQGTMYKNALERIQKIRDGKLKV